MRAPGVEGGLGMPGNQLIEERDMAGFASRQASGQGVGVRYSDLCGRDVAGHEPGQRLGGVG